jgi:CDP-glucose 4,6-dehydratase
VEDLEGLAPRPAIRFKPGVYKGKRVFVTGHTGFKGAWLCGLLVRLGADVTGFALAPPTAPSLFDISKMAHCVRSVTGDVRDYPALKAAFDAAQPEIVFHLAAQRWSGTAIEIRRSLMRPM